MIVKCIYKLKDYQYFWYIQIYKIKMDVEWILKYNGDFISNYIIIYV